MMMIHAKMDIKIALIGHVSVGKTTVLNALFRDKFGEVSMKRTTAGINYFRIKPKRRPETNQNDEGGKNSIALTGENGEKWADAVSYDTKPAGLILKEITTDNETLRNSTGIHEKFFDIERDEALCDMREDANLVVVDIPGINEAGVGSKYRDFVEQKWDTFDVVVLVMDGKQGVNTEEEVKLLEFAKSNQETKRQISLIILLNKVDDPDDEEQSLLVEESRKEAEKLFNVGDPTLFLEAIPQSTTNEARKTNKAESVIIPTSAMHAYFYRTASLMTLEQFKKLDKELIEKIGREEVGRFKWKLLTQNMRYQAVYDAVSDEGQYKVRLKATNFDKFLRALRYFIGDEQAQLDMMKDQVLVSLKKLPHHQGLTSELKSAYDKSKIVGMPSESLSSHFWSKYDELENRSIDKFTGPNSIDVLSEAMIELRDFYHVASQAPWPDDQKKSLERMRILVRRILLCVFEKAMACSVSLKDGSLIPKSPPLQWTDLSPFDWKSICGSILLLSYSKTFCTTFGREKVLLEVLAESMNMATSIHEFCIHCQKIKWVAFAQKNSSTNAKCTTCGQHCIELRSIFPLTDHEAFLASGDLFSNAFDVPFPSTFEDPKHWGHLAWIYCELLDSRV